MLLSADTALQKVFLIFGAFWVAVLMILLVGVGALLKKHDRLLKKGGHGDADSSH